MKNMKKLLLSAILGLAALAIVNPAAAFPAIGGSNRGWDGSKLTIVSQNSGRAYTFYGTAESCPGRSGASYDTMSYVMNGNPFEVTVTPCGNGLVWVCANDGINWACSGYAKRYVGQYY